MADRLADQISYLIAGAGWRLEQQIKAAAGASDLPVEQWRILALLDEQGGRTMSDLAQNAFLEAPTLTKMIDRMVADGLVYRVPDSHDRRRILIFASDRGRSRCGQMRGVIADCEEQIFRRLGPHGLTFLQDLLHDLSVVPGWKPLVAKDDRDRPFATVGRPANS